MHVACANDRARVVDAILDRGGMLNEVVNGVTPLFVACSAEKVEVVKALLKRQGIEESFDVADDVTNMTPKFIATMGEHIAIVRLLEAKGGYGLRGVAAQATSLIAVHY